jgi:hypothetical protein
MVVKAAKLRAVGEAGADQGQAAGAAHLRLMSPGQLADAAGKLKATLADIKDEAIRRELRRAEGTAYRLTLSEPGRQTRLDRARLEQDHGHDLVAPYLYEEDTSWVMRVTARKGL